MIYIANFGEGPYNVQLADNFDSTLPTSMTVKISSLDSTKYVGIPLSISPISLEAGEALILRSK